MSKAKITEELIKELAEKVKEGICNDLRNENLNVGDKLDSIFNSINKLGKIVEEYVDMCDGGEV